MNKREFKHHGNNPNVSYKSLSIDALIKENTNYYNFPEDSQELLNKKYEKEKDSSLYSFIVENYHLVKQYSDLWFKLRTFLRESSIYTSSNFANVLGLWEPESVVHFKGVKYAKMYSKRGSSFKNEFFIGESIISDLGHKINMEFGTKHEANAIALVLELFPECKYFETGTFVGNSPINQKPIYSCSPDGLLLNTNNSIKKILSSAGINLEMDENSYLAVEIKFRSFFQFNGKDKAEKDMMFSSKAFIKPFETIPYYYILQLFNEIDCTTALGCLFVSATLFQGATIFFVEIDRNLFKLAYELLHWFNDKYSKIEYSDLLKMKVHPYDEIFDKYKNFLSELENFASQTKPFLRVDKSIKIWQLPKYTKHFKNETPYV